MIYHLLKIRPGGLNLIQKPCHNQSNKDALHQMMLNKLLLDIQFLQDQLLQPWSLKVLIDHLHQSQEEQCFVVSWDVI